MNTYNFNVLASKKRWKHFAFSSENQPDFDPTKPRFTVNFDGMDIQANPDTITLYQRGARYSTGIYRNTVQFTCILAVDIESQNFCDIIKITCYSVEKRRTQYIVTAY